MDKTSYEKKTFLEEIIQLTVNPIRKGEIQQKHYAFALKETNGRKGHKNVA